MAYTKQRLYQDIERLRHKLSFTQQDYPLHLVEFCESHPSRVGVGKLALTTSGLRGMAQVGGKKEDGTTEIDVILLNSNLSEPEQNFFCGHEMIHLYLHRGKLGKSFNCFDEIQPQQDGFIEWQANEGAAELLIPYRMLLPKIKEQSKNLTHWHKIFQLRIQLAEEFSVSQAVMELRLQSLRFEILQYLGGVPLEQIQILSQRQQAQQGICLPSLVDLEEQDFDHLLRLCAPTK